MKKYLEPEVVVLMLSEEDIVCTSNVNLNEGGGDGVKLNGGYGGLK